MKTTYWVGGMVALVLAIAIACINTGAYNVAADVPHWSLTQSILERVRRRSIARRSAGIEVPALDDAALVISGAGNYDAMCAGCHLKPGVESTEMSRGLSPAPPSLVERSPAKSATDFWVIKHGIKMTGMPAWGKSMDDRYIWGLVAFVNELPGMTSDRYRELVDASGGHQHGGSESSMESESPDHGHEPGDGAHAHEGDPDAEDDSTAPPHQH
jgi:mono/diheme cytochrome c family protein